MAKAAKQCRPLAEFFVPVSNVEESRPQSVMPTISSDNTTSENHRYQAKKDLEKMLKSKQTQLTNQDRTRHFAVLQFMNYQEQLKENHQRETRAAAALNVARCFSRGTFFSRKLITWERSWIDKGYIPEGRQGCFVKSKSWFNDEGVMLAAREYLSGAGQSEFIFGELFNYILLTF
jgi:hypothetical protein